MSSDLPNEASITQLIGAVLLEQNEECLLRWRYMQIEGMDQLTPLLLDAEPAKRRLTNATSSSMATYLILTDITESLDTFGSPTLSEQERVLSIEPHGRSEN